MFVVLRNGWRLDTEKLEEMTYPDSPSHGGILTDEVGRLEGSVLNLHSMQNEID